MEMPGQNHIPDTSHPSEVPQYALNMKLGGSQSQAAHYIEE